MTLKIKESETLEHYNAIAYKYYLNSGEKREWRRDFCRTTPFHKGKEALKQHYAENGAVKCFMCNKPILRGERTQILYLTGIPDPRKIFNPKTAKICHRSCLQSSRLRV